jgi:hypothetical protein
MDQRHVSFEHRATCPARGRNGESLCAFGYEEKANHSAKKRSSRALCSEKNFAMLIHTHVLYIAQAAFVVVGDFGAKAAS